MVRPPGEVLRRGRLAAETLMVDTCAITRPTGPPGPVDPVTGLRTPAPTTTVYGPSIDPDQGRCKVQTYEPYETDRESGDHVWTQQRYNLHVPIGAPVVEVGDTVEIVTSRFNPSLVGRVYRVAGEHAKSMATARRLLIDEVLD